VAPCKLDAATAAAIDACDTIDEVADGVIEDPARCDYDPSELVGTIAGECGTFTAADAALVRQLWDGPRREDGSFLWIGAPKGSSLTALSGSRGDPLEPQAMSITLDWWLYFLSQDPDFDWRTLSHAGFVRFFEQSVEQFGLVIGTDNPDLRAFRDRGGKAIVWHGWADQLISAYGTTNYYERVLAEMGGASQTDDFFRLFMAPGVGHCAGGAGPTPYGQLEALLAWVEDGDAPDMLPAALREQGVITRSRPLCQYPLVARYRGNGSTDEAENFVCSADFLTQ
jgi:hypothetical protein